MQVLLVEDDLTWASSVELMLRKSGHGCVVINMGEPAIAVAKSGTFDLIILDIMLPDLDGFEVMAGLKQAGCDTPVLVQSGLIDKDDQDDAHAFGANHVLIKPFGHVELLETMVKILAPPDSEDSSTVKEATLERPAKEATLVLTDEVITLTPMDESEEEDVPPEADSATEDYDDVPPPPKRTKESRSKALVAAEIISGDKPLPCMILNISEGGASIRLPRHMTDHPKHFRLRLQSGDTYDCRVCWRVTDKIGVKFLD